MRIKQTIKKISKYFFDFKKEDETIIGQSVLLIDNGHTWFGFVDAAIERIKKNFPQAEISILAFEERKVNLQKDFPSLNYILPSQRLKPKRYQLALQLLMMPKRKYDFVILLSLDITPLIVSLLFFKSKIVLYNQWGQWWSLKFRNVSEIFKITYVKKKTRFNFKNLLKRIGLIFVILKREREETLRHSILVIDNGYAPYEQIGYGMQRIKELLPKAKISVLALERRRDLEYNFPDLEIIEPGECIIKRYSLARHMFRLRKNKYDYIILLSLDITPIIVSMLLMKGKVVLFNQWYQWWTLKPKSIGGYLMILPQLIFNIIVFIYLLISVSWIFLKRIFNVFRFSLLSRGV